MKTTITIDAEVFAEASKLTGISDEDELICEALEALISRETGRRMIDLGGSMPDIEDVSRRRSEAN